jgi:hypothetical protein
MSPRDDVRDGHRRKADIDPHTCLISSIYLPENELAVLAASLAGIPIRKLRHRLRSPIPSVKLHIDEFQAAHAGLLLAEAEFESADVLAAFTGPPVRGAAGSDERPAIHGRYARA